MDGVSAKRVNVAASNHESSPPSEGGSPAAALALATAFTIGWAGSTSAGGMSSAHSIAGGGSAGHRAPAAAAPHPDSVSDPTPRAPPSPAALARLFPTSQVSEQ